MKKVVKKVVKLLDFLIRILTRGLKKGAETLEAIKEAAEKTEKLSPVLLEIADIITKLQAKRDELSKIAEE